MSTTTDLTMKMKIISLVGVALLGVACANQSVATVPDAQPISDVENEGTRQLETPEVVLQLKYDEGELKRIYLAQFRKPGKSWSPSVSDRSTLCADLCHAGLGGSVCGSSCSQLIPLGLHSVLVDNSTEGIERVAEIRGFCMAPLRDMYSMTEGDVDYGQPRVGVCPVLCDNFMGKPLCQCPQPASEDSTTRRVDWTAVCDAFCADGYTLSGCPSCEPTTTSPDLMLYSGRALSTTAGWSAWCDVQCRQGHGGAACNCDRTPFQ